MFNNQQNNKFTPEQIKNFVGLYLVIKKVHTRLINEGYKIKTEKIIPPKKNFT